ncbi:hypothetical protein Bca4012_051386 [Brassica carinata]
MLMVMRNINESSDGLSVNVIKENHVDVQPAIYDVLFMRRLASPLGVVLVYVFSGEEGSLILWPLLVHTMSMRIFGFSYNIIVVVVTEVSHSLRILWVKKSSRSLRMHLGPIWIRKGSLESVVYWQVLHCEFHKLRIWDVDKLLKNLNEISTTASWRSYVTCVSRMYSWEADRPWILPIINHGL